jgi:hypothetical protein
MDSDSKIRRWSSLKLLLLRRWSRSFEPYAGYVGIGLGLLVASSGLTPCLLVLLALWVAVVAGLEILVRDGVVVQMRRGVRQLEIARQIARLR